MSDNYTVQAFLIGCCAYFEHKQYQYTYKYIPIKHNHMSDQLNYVIKQGEVESDCLPETLQFIAENSQYFYTELEDIREELSDLGEIVYVSYEKSWSFVAVIEKSEFGRISKGKGTIVEGGKCSYDEILTSFESK